MKDHGPDVQQTHAAQLVPALVAARNGHGRHCSRVNHEHRVRMIRRAEKPPATLGDTFPLAPALDTARNGGRRHRLQQAGSSGQSAEGP